MHFISAGDIIGPDHKIRSITLQDTATLPDGKYTFIEFYCTDSNCDCRKTIIRIHHNGHHVSTINYGWESPKFYAKWGRIDDEMSREMSGLSIDYTSPDEINPDATIALLEQLLDEQYISKLKSNYKQVRTTIAKQNNIISHQQQPKLSRNTPCHCGSGKKYKRCCIDLTPEIQHQDIIPFPNSRPDARPEITEYEDPFFYPDFHESTHQLPTPKKISQTLIQAQTHIENKAFHKAEPLLLALLEDHPLHPEANFLNGVLLALQEDPKTAIPFFEQAVDSSPYFPEAWHNLGLAYRQTADITGSINCARQAIQYAEPEDAFVAENQQYIHDTEKHIHQTTGQTLDEFISQQLIFDSAFLLMELEDIPAAIEGFQAVIDLAPDNYQSHGNLGICHAKLGEKQQALHHLNKAIEIEPDYKVATSNLSIIEAMKDGEKLQTPTQTVRRAHTGMKPI